MQIDLRTSELKPQDWQWKVSTPVRSAECTQPVPQVGEGDDGADIELMV